MTIAIFFDVETYALSPQLLLIIQQRSGVFSFGAPRSVRGRILVRVVNAPLPPEAKKILKKFDYEMVHSEVYLNKHVVSIAPFSTPACPDCSQNIT